MFFHKHKKILENKRGSGYWLWKPYFIVKTLEKMKMNDILIYTDAGTMYIDRIEKLIEAMQLAKTDKMIFQLGNRLKESMYTKRDAFILMDCDSRDYYDTPQIDASIILMVNNTKNQRFVRDWLNYACDERLITDVPNTLGKNNYSDFIMHRHDQSILSLWSKKNSCLLFRDPSQWGSIDIAEYDNEILERSIYPQIVNHHRLAKAKTKIYVSWKQTELSKKITHKLFLLEKRMVEKNEK